MKSIARFIFLYTLCLLMFSCESNNSFRTEAGLKSALQGKWDWEPIPSKQFPQIWDFESGTLTVTEYQDRTFSSVRFTEQATYKVATTITTPYIFIDGGRYEGKWIVITLDKKILAMDKTAPGTNSLIQKEFIKF